MPAWARFTFLRQRTPLALQILTAELAMKHNSCFAYHIVRLCLDELARSTRLPALMPSLSPAYHNQQTVRYLGAQCQGGERISDGWNSLLNYFIDVRGNRATSITMVW
jgi:hypothetical protein